MTLAKSTALLFALCQILQGCSRQDSSNAISGTWVRDDGGGYYSITTFADGGSYISRIRVSTSSGPRQYTVEGRFEVRDGFLIDTAVKHSMTNALLPFTSRSRIIKHTDSELVLQREGMTNTVSLRKEKQ